MFGDICGGCFNCCCIDIGGGNFILSKDGGGGSNDFIIGTPASIGCCCCVGCIALGSTLPSSCAIILRDLSSNAFAAAERNVDCAFCIRSCSNCSNCLCSSSLRCFSASAAALANFSFCSA